MPSPEDAPPVLGAPPAWPALPLAEWRGTEETLHRLSQLIGKVRLGLAPFHNHWWHVTLSVGTTGLTTGPMPAGRRTIELELDLTAHRVVARTEDGATDGSALVDGTSIAELYTATTGLLERCGVEVHLLPRPFDLPGPAFPDDTRPRPYDAAAATRYLAVLRQVDRVLTEFAGWFGGKQSPVQLFWHSFDLALARYSGRPAPVAADVDRITAEAYSHEVIAFGFWPGDDNTDAAFYSYTAPEPDGLTERPLRPADAVWLPEGGTAQLAYDVVRRAGDPRATLLEFLSSAYDAGAGAAGWDTDALATRADPSRRRG